MDFSLNVIMKLLPAIDEVILMKAFFTGHLKTHVWNQVTKKSLQP